MAEPQKQSHSPDAEKEKISTVSDAFATALTWVGDYGKWQWKMMFITAFCGVFTGMQNFGAVFLAAKPDHWCQLPWSDRNASSTLAIRNQTTPWIRGKDGSMVPSECTYFAHNHTQAADVAQCDSWFYDKTIYESTIVSEWDLVCDNQWMMPTTQSTYMLGILTGAVLFSSLSDRWGRRPSSLLCVLIFFVATNAVPFSQTFSTFLILRFIVAAAGQGLFLVTFILLMECLGINARTMLGTLFHAGFTIGFTLFALIGYFVRDWRSLQHCTSIPAVLLFSYWWLLPESPRWLMMVGRFDEAVEVLNQIAVTNNKPKPDASKWKTIQAVITKDLESVKQELTLKEKFGATYESLVTLVRTPNMRRRNCITFYAWFVTSMIYYGLAFNGANINASVYVNVFAAGLVEMPALFVTVVALGRIGRRVTLSWAMLISGVSCVGIAFVPQDMVWLNIGLATCGKFMMTVSFCVIFFFSAELVPTHVRNISIGVASMWGRIGSAICPFIVDLLGAVYYAIPSTVFGVAALICGFLVLLLPEPGNDKLPESVEEIESLVK